jgi:hypothetical protein
VQVNVRRNISDFTSVDSNLICKHARSRDLDGIRPIVVVVAQRISEVQDSVLRDKGGVLSHIEVSGLNSTLSNCMRNEEEIEFAVNNFRLFNESLIQIGSLGWVENLMADLFEESLSDSLVDNNQSDLRKRLLLASGLSILVSHDLLELLEFKLNDLLSHGITNTISVDENVVGKLTSVEILIGI